MKRVLLAMSCLAAFNVSAETMGKTNLMLAAEYNDLYNLEKLIKAGYNINAVDSNNNTAYCYAYSRKHLNAAKTLESFGADTARRCNINGEKFVTRSLTVPYQNGKENSLIARKRTTKFKSGFLGTAKPYFYVGAGLVGVAAAAGGGGGGGGSDSGGGFTRPPTSTDVDPTAFRTSEFYGNAAGAGLSEAADSEFLSIINAEFAYARGYTGTGQKIAILDSGLDTDHIEFSDSANAPDKVVAADLVGSDLQGSDNDPNHGANSDHGTNVASVAAGTKDGNGMHGVAYGSQIIGYRMGVDGIGNELSINGAFTDEVVADAIGKGVKIFNLSFGLPTRDQFGNPTENATDADQDKMEGRFTGAFVAGGGINPAMTTMVNNITTNEAILVMAAGNNYTTESSISTALPLHFTDMQGHFVNVVALNQAGNSIASYSNHCGITKDYCIASPGTNLMLANDGGNYQLNSGTSFAAPTVSGAVAVVNQAFGLSADRTLNILFKTATDMGAAGVDDVYGHGLLNLDKATAPGADLIALSSSSSVSFNNTKVTTSGAFANLAVPNFVIEDELYRTFKVNGNNLKVAKEDNFDLQKREKSFAKEKKVVTKKLTNGLTTSFVMSNSSGTEALDSFDHMSVAGEYKNIDILFGFTNTPGVELNDIAKSSNLLQDNALANPYLNLAEKGFVATSAYPLSDNLNFQTSVFFGDIENSDNKNLGKSTSAIAKLIYNYTDDTKFSFESGFLNEKHTVLGSKFEGALALADDNYTYFTGLTAKTKLTAKLDVFANAYIGVTKAEKADASLVSNVSDIVSRAASIGAQYNITDKKAAGLVFSQPLKVENGDLSMTYVRGGNIDKGYQNSKLTQDLSPKASQLDVQAFYKEKLTEKSNLNIGFLHSINADNQKGEDKTSVLVKYRSKF